ncbi:MAG: hypothetical protein D6706_18050 [Chloroflexi bacterium]|nr:MAG: hypothetical protein D6706_18050 [Chloroflexota bacterium]
MRQLFWVFSCLLALVACKGGGGEAGGGETAVTATPSPTATETAESLSQQERLLATLAKVTPDDWQQGTADPKITIIEYSDFQ